MKVSLLPSSCIKVLDPRLATRWHCYPTAATRWRSTSIRMMPPISLGLLGEGGVRGGNGGGAWHERGAAKPPTSFSRVTSTRCKEERVNYRLMDRLLPGVHHPRSQSRATHTPHPITPSREAGLKLNLLGLGSPR